MTLAIITDTYLTTKPWDYKTDFLNAWKTAVVNAGFPSTTLDTFDKTDEQAYWQSGRPVYQAGNAKSHVGFIKQMVFDGAKTKGTLQFNFSMRKIAKRSEANGLGYDTGDDDVNARPVSSMFAFYGGWDTTGKTPNLTSSQDSCLSGYVNNYAGNLSQQTYSARCGAWDYTVDTSYDSTLNNSSNNHAGVFPLGYTHSPGYSTGAAQFNYGVYYGYGMGGNYNPLSWTYNPGEIVQFKAINHPEIRGVYILCPNRAPIFHGYIRPANKPSYWDENNYPYCFIPQTPYFNFFQGFSGSYSPLNSDFNAMHFINSPSYFYTNPGNSNKYDLLVAPILMSNDRKAIIGKFSADLLVAPSQNISQFDRLIVTSGVEEYLVLGNTRRLGYDPILAIRVV